MDTTTIGLIIVPVTLALLGGIFAAVRAIIRFAQYFVRAEEAQHAMTESTEAMHAKLGEYIERTDHRIHAMDRRVSIIEFALSKVIPQPQPRPPLEGYQDD